MSGKFPRSNLLANADESESMQSAIDEKKNKDEQAKLDAAEEAAKKAAEDQAKRSEDEKKKAWQDAKNLYGSLDLEDSQLLDD